MREAATPEITILDWAGFSCAVSYSFDDGCVSQLDAFPRLQELGIRATFYLCSGWSGADSDVWQQAQRRGHELGNHTAHHPTSDGNGGTLDIAADTDACTVFLESRYGASPRTMAAPYGDLGYARIARNRFLLMRGVKEGRLLPNSEQDPHALPSHVPAEGATAESFNQIVDGARQAGAWQIFTLHGFFGKNDQAYHPIALEEFLTHVRHVQGLGDVWIDNVETIGAYWLGQRLLTAIKPTRLGPTTLWRWNLPAHFPPRQRLRVTASRGTLHQNGQALRADEQGYYEVALDEGELSLTPT